MRHDNIKAWKFFPLLYTHNHFVGKHDDYCAHGKQHLGPTHDDVIKWKHFPRYWPFVWGIHRSPVNSPHKGQWRRALIFSFICAWINGWVNNRKAGSLRRHRADYDVTVMQLLSTFRNPFNQQSYLVVAYSIGCPIMCKWLNSTILITVMFDNLVWHLYASRDAKNKYTQPKK